MAAVMIALHDRSADNPESHARDVGLPGKLLETSDKLSIESFSKTGIACDSAQARPEFRA